MGLCDRSAFELSGMLERRDVSCVELMQDTLQRIDQVNPSVNALVSLCDRDDLLAQAAKADQAERAGWMHGLPIAVKDLANAAGLPTSMGSPLFKSNVPSKDDIMVSRMRDAGAIFIGKTNTPEFGLGSHTYNPLFGATKNPYDLSKSAGGSSGGAAAALATGMVSVADGSDMMGSLRNPAGWCNVYGMRPTWGVVPHEAVGDVYLNMLSTEGPMARDPRDLEMLLRVQSGAYDAQPLSTGLQATEHKRPTSLQGLRIGWLGNWGGALPFDDGLLETSEASLVTLQELGADVEDVPPPFSLDEMWTSWIDLRSWLVAAKLGGFYKNSATKEMLKPAAQWEVSRGLSMSGEAIHTASVTRSMWFQKVRRLFETYDAFILPSAQVWPFDVRIDHPTEINGVTMDTYHRWMQVVVPASLIGLPVVNLPAGFGDAGLPFGLQLIGPRMSDLSLLSMAQIWHDATRWTEHKPKLS